jgi:hypothetical protein
VLFIRTEKPGDRRAFSDLLREAQVALKLDVKDETIGAIGFRCKFPAPRKSSPNPRTDNPLPLQERSGRIP